VDCRNPIVQCTAGAATGTNLDMVLKITLAALKGHIPGTYQGTQHHPDGPEGTQHKIRFTTPSFLFYWEWDRIQRSSKDKICVGQEHTSVSAMERKKKKKC
jgi:hypothetical protein